MRAKAAPMNQTISLNLPDAERKQFNKNYLRSVVVEFKFPTLLEIAEKLPVDLQKEAREFFPHYNKAHVANLTPHGSDHEITHDFASKSKKELVRLSQNSLSVTFSNYNSYEAFKEIVINVLSIFVPHLETNFFTRVGLRYINNIDTPNIRGEVSEWINRSLVAYIADGVIGSIRDLKMEVGGEIDQNSKFHFRCGLVPKPGGIEPESTDKATFLLDFDYYTEDVETGKVQDLMDYYHDINFKFFWWTLGEKARKELEDA